MQWEIEVKIGEYVGTEGSLRERFSCLSDVENELPRKKISKRLKEENPEDIEDMVQKLNLILEKLWEMSDLNYHESIHKIGHC